MNSWDNEENIPVGCVPPAQLMLYARRSCMHATLQQTMHTHATTHFYDNYHPVYLHKLHHDYNYMLLYQVPIYNKNAFQ